MDYMSEYKRWLDCSALSADEHAELAAVADNQEEIESRFFAPLSFGTAGLRGVLGVGLNRMNRFTVGQAAQGLANLIVSNGQAAMDRGVAIAYDSRHFSAEFAKQSACIMAANGIQSLLFDELRPTPELSFAVRHYGCIAGINITASHNPKEYNGYKVYWEDGAQLPPAEADVVASEMAKTDIFTGVKTADYDESVKNGLIRILSKETDEAYLGEVIKLSLIHILETKFTDCRDDPNVNNAAALGIVTGYEDGTFRPYKTISRQEAAAMLDRLYQVLGGKTDVVSEKVFADDAKIGNWARGSVYAMRQTGIMQGKENNQFCPTDGYTAEQSIVTCLLYTSSSPARRPKPRPRPISTVSASFSSSATTTLLLSTFSIFTFAPPDPDVYKRQQYIILLPQANYENSRMVADRLVSAFYRRYPHSPARLRYTVQPLA